MPFFPNISLTPLKKLFRATEQPGAFVVGDVISPVMPLQDIIAVTSTTGVTQGGSVTGIGQGFGATVEEDEAWLVQSFASVTDVLDADQAVTLQGFIFHPGIGIRNYGDPVVIGASTQGGWGKVFTPPMLLIPGQRLGVVVVDITVGAAGLIGLNATTVRVVIPV